MEKFLEIQWAETFARHYNTENNTDFRVVKAKNQNDSADVYLRASGLPDQPVQIVRMTNPESMQAHIALIRFHRRLRQKIVSIVPEMLEVTVELKREIHPKEIEGLINKIGSILMHLKDDPLTEPKVIPFESSAVNKLTLEKFQIRMQSNVHVQAPHKKYDLKNRIEKAIKLKREKHYSDQSNLWLLIVEYDDPYSPTDFDRHVRGSEIKKVGDFSRIFYLCPVEPRAFYREI